MGACTIGFGGDVLRLSNSVSQVELCCDTLTTDDGSIQHSPAVSALHSWVETSPRRAAPTTQLMHYELTHCTPRSQLVSQESSGIRAYLRQFGASVAPQGLY